MVQINFASREVNCKIVYYGPGRCGKTTNLQIVHAKAPQNSTGELVSIATETDRTLYFDFLPLDLGTVAGMRTKFQLYTVPGQVYYDATRKLVLQGCDGIVFVADSNPDIMAENIESLDNLAKNLAENGLDIMDLPLVLQFNKRDMPNAMPVAEMAQALNRNNWPVVEAVAVNGDGVFQTLKSISQQVIRRLNREQGFADTGERKAKSVSSAMKSPITAGAAGAPPPPPSPPPRPAIAVAPPPPVIRPAAPPPPAPLKPSAPPLVAPAARSAAPAPQPVAQAQPVVPAQPVMQPAANIQPVPEDGPGKQEWKTKTGMFRDRMKELRASKAEEAQRKEAAQTAVEAPPAPKKKKGCMGMLLIGIGILSAGVAGSWHWFS
jgi:signal recognition particle receptor subunit beta